MPDLISRLFTVDNTMVDIARRGFRIYFIFFPVVGGQIVIQNYFQSIGKPRLSIFLSLTRQLIFLLPLLWLLSSRYGVDGVWGSMAASDLLSALLACATVLVMNRKIQKQIQFPAKLNAKSN